MTFTLCDQRLASMPAIVLTNTESGEEVEILPALGGTVQRLRLDTGSGVREVLAGDAEAELRANPLFRGRLLCPFNDRIAHARYRFGGQDFQLISNSPDDDSALHGLVYDQPFQVLERSATAAAARLVLGFELQPEAFTGYPFALRLRMSYELRAGGLQCSVELENRGSSALPLTFGWHPYFRLSDDLASHHLTLPSRRFVEVDAQLLPTGNVLPVAGTEFDFGRASVLGTRALDMAVTAPESGSTLLSAGSERLALRQDTQFFRYVQLFIPPDRKSIAIEPVSAATDAFNRPELGLTVLAAGATLKSWFGVSGGAALARDGAS